MRWHVRPFCHIDNKFKDFLLSRCFNTREFGEPLARSEDDTLWHDCFTVNLAPNPKLSVSQQEIIAQDYGMKGGCREVRIRRALLYYFQKRLRLDIADKVDNPQEISVIVDNRAQFADALKDVKT